MEPLNVNTLKHTRKAIKTLGQKTGIPALTLTNGI